MAALLLVGCGAGGKSATGGSTKERPPAKVVASGFGQNGKYVEGIAIVTSDNPASVGRGVTASANFLDAVGHVIATEEQVESFSWPDQQLVLPVWLDLSNSPPDTKVASGDVSVSVSDYATPKSPDMKPLPVLVSNRIRRNSYGGFTTDFTFTNDTGADLKDLRVGVVCYDAGGTIIGGSSIYPNLAPAGKPIRLEPTTLTVSGEPITCKAFPNYGY